MAIQGELGVTGLLQYSGYVQESWIQDLRTSSKKVKVFDEISRLDPVGAAMLQTTKMFLQGARVHVKPGGTEDIDREMADFLEDSLLLPGLRVDGHGNCL